jgi:hypothetical protein
MGDFNIISDVSATLASVLTDGLSTLAPAPPPIAEVSDLQGNISTNPARVTLFLFEVIEDPSARNRPPVRRDTPPTVAVSKPPMALLLRYLLTPWSGDRLTDHRILGRVLQVLYDGAILSGAQLVGGLAGGPEALKLTLAPLTLEERSRVFHAVQKPYHLSVSYDVRVVEVDTEREQVRRPVASRTLVPATGVSSP